MLIWWFGTQSRTAVLEKARGGSFPRHGFSTLTPALLRSGKTKRAPTFLGQLDQDFRKHKGAAASIPDAAVLHRGQRAAGEAFALQIHSQPVGASALLL